MSNYDDRLAALPAEPIGPYLKGRNGIYQEAIEEEPPRAALHYECLARWNDLLSRALLHYDMLERPLSAESDWMERGLDSLEEIDCSGDAKKEFAQRFRRYCIEQADSFKRLERKRRRMEDSDVFIRAPHVDGEEHNDRVHRLVMERDPTYRAIFEKMTGDGIRRFVDAELMPLLDADAGATHHAPTIHPTDEVTMPDEKTIYTGNPSQKTLIGTHIITVLLAPLTVGLSLLYSAWKAFELSKTEYTLTNQRLRVEKGALSRQTDELELYRVKDSKLQEPFLLRSMGLANIKLFTSDPTHPEVKLKGVEGGRQLREKIREHSQRLREQKGVREVDFS